MRKHRTLIGVTVVTFAMVSLLGSFCRFTLADAGEVTVRQAPAESEAGNPYANCPLASVSTFEPYCGLKSVCAAALALGHTAGPRDLLRPDFVGTRGSTAEQLSDAAEHLGLHARVVSRLTCAALRAASAVTILHTKANPDSPDYDHWVLCIGFEGDSALIIDANKPRARVPMRDLNGVWDGSGVIVANDPISVWPLQLFSVLQWSAYVLTACLIALVARGVVRKARLAFASRSPRTTRAAEVLALTIIAVAAAGLFPLILTSGYLNSQWACAGLVERHVPEFLPTVSSAQLEAHLKGESAPLLVDARFSADYEAGHIGHAINISPNSSVEECVSKIGPGSTGRSLIVYCNVPECPYAGIVARKLVDAGYSDVRLFREGYTARAHHQNVTGPR
jgi:rhodanese-related sulfurtransferase